MAGREIEKLIEAAPAFSYLAVVQRSGILHHHPAIYANSSNQRTAGLQVELRFPGLLSIILPAHDGITALRSYSNRPRLHTAQVHRNGGPHERGRGYATEQSNYSQHVLRLRT